MTHRVFVIGHRDVPATGQPELAQVFGGRLQGYGAWIGMIRGGVAGVAVGGPPRFGGVRVTSFDESVDRMAHTTVSGGVLAPRCRPRCTTGGLDRSSNSQSRSAHRAAAEARGDLRPTRRMPTGATDCLGPLCVHSVQSAESSQAPVGGVPPANLTRRWYPVADRELRSSRRNALKDRVTLDTARSGNMVGQGRTSLGGRFKAGRTACNHERLKLPQQLVTRIVGRFDIHSAVVAVPIALHSLTGEFEETGVLEQHLPVDRGGRGAQPAVMSPLPEELRSTWAGFPV